MTSVVQDVRRWLGLEQPKIVPARQRAPAPRPRVPKSLPGTEAIEARIEALLKGSTELLDGQVNVIGLSGLRERMGSRWSVMAPRAISIGKRAMEKRLTPVDVWTQLDEVDWLVILPSLVGDAARVKCGSIGEDIARGMLGDGFRPQAIEDYVEVLTATSRQEGRYVFERTTGLAALSQRLVEDLRASRAADPAAPSGDDDATASEIQPLAEAAQLGPTSSWVPVSAPNAPSAETEQLFAYRPIWDVRNGVVSTYMCRPTPTANIPPEEVDFAALGRVVRDFRQLTQARRRVLLAVPVAYETLAGNARRRRYIELCRMLPALQKPLVVFEMTDVPRGAAAARLPEFVSLLRPYARTVMQRVSLARPGLRPVAETGIGTIGVDLDEIDAGDSTIAQGLARFAEAASAVQLSTYVHGARSMPVVVAAVDAQFSYIAGEPIAEPIDLPEAIYRFGINDVLRRHALAKGGAVEDTASAA
jgi:hypothetical protein